MDFCVFVCVDLQGQQRSESLRSVLFEGSIAWFDLWKSKQGCV